MPPRDDIIMEKNVVSDTISNATTPELTTFTNKIIGKPISIKEVLSTPKTSEMFRDFCMREQYVMRT
jgi:hypothetical protein